MLNGFAETFSDNACLARNELARLRRPQNKITERGRIFTHFDTNMIHCRFRAIGGNSIYSVDIL